MAASVNDTGGLLVVTFPHPVHGQVQLTAAPDLRTAARYDQTAVRRYRQRLSARSAPSFGLGAIERDVRSRARLPAWLWHEAIPMTTLGPAPDDAAAPELVTFVPHPDDVDGARAVVQLRLPDRRWHRPFRWGGRFRLARAPYPQLTEGGPLPELALRPTVDRVEGALVIGDDGLGAAVALGGGLVSSSGLVSSGPRTRARARARARARRGWISVDVAMERDWDAVVIGLGADATVARHSLRTVLDLGPRSLFGASGRRWTRRWERWPQDAGPLSSMGRRGLAYALGCCVVPAGQGTCFITDHRILPLAWTRDGYFVARAFLDWGNATGQTEVVRLVRGHLEWLFRVADRPHGWWARSYLIGGQRKDEAFQADQQLYPLLELADYAHDTGDLEPVAAYSDGVPGILASLDRRAHDRTGLFATDESPGDDPVPGLYLISTQILAWRTLTRLASLGIGGREIAARAEAIKTAVRREYTAAVDGSSVMAYAIDSAGQMWHDFDANDLPLAMAETWGFVPRDDATWAATMTRALSAGQTGFFAGPLGGLGSVHTPAPWPLGQLQAVIAGSRDGSDPALGHLADRAIDALRHEAQWDGLLPEASDPRNGRPISRPWFAWPGAVAASEHLVGQITGSRGSR